MNKNRLVVLEMLVVLAVVGMLALAPWEKAVATSYNGMVSENKHLGKDSKDPSQQSKGVPQMKDESKSSVMGEQMPMKVSLTDQKGNWFGTVKVLHKGERSVVLAMVRPAGIKNTISAWLVAGSKEDTKASNWIKFGDVIATQLGHSESVKRVNVFSQHLDFIPTNGDKIVIASCGSSTCAPLTQIATATIK